VLTIQRTVDVLAARRQEMKRGRVLFVKIRKMGGGCFFVKKVENRGCIMYSISIFWFTYYLFGGFARTQSTNPLPTGRTGRSLPAPIGLQHRARCLISRAFQFTIRIDSIRFVSRIDSNRLVLVKKSAFRFTSYYFQLPLTV